MDKAGSGDAVEGEWSKQEHRWSGERGEGGPLGTEAVDCAWQV